MLVPRTYDEWAERGIWGTPLTTACAEGRLDTCHLWWPLKIDTASPPNALALAMEYLDTSLAVLTVLV